MRSLKTIRLVYFVYTAYTFFVIAVSDYNPAIAAAGLLCIWPVYCAYSLGFKSIKGYSNSETKYDGNNEKFLFSQIAEWKPIQYFSASFISWMCSAMAARFYTGRGFFRVIRGLFNGERAYSIYQHHIIEAKIGTFTLRKIPFILMLVFTTVILFWSMLGLLASEKKMTKIQIVYLVSAVASYFYFGIARGTNFEMYIIFVLFVFCLLNRTGNTKKDMKKQRKAIVGLSVLAVGVVLIFRMVVAARGNVFRNQICTEIVFDETRLISRLFPTITNIALSVFRYFGFGIFTIGMVMDRIVLNTIQGIVAYCMPMGFELFFGNDLMSITRKTVDIGVGWVPDYISFINTFGLFLTLFLFYFIGKLIGGLQLSNRARLLKNLISMVAFLEMLSLPVGNFIATSTPNELAVLLILLWYFKGNLHITVGRKRLL